MILDSQLRLSNAQVVCNSGSEVSDNVIDLSTLKDKFKGTPLAAVFTVDEAFATATSIAFAIQTATNSDGTTGAVKIAQTETIPIAELTAGRDPIVLALGPLPESGGAQRYLAAYYTLTGSNATAGKVTCYITPLIMAETNI